MSGSEYRGKRALDLLASAAGLVVLAPVLALAALAVRLTSPGPALFRAVRVGRGGSAFEVYKFRTMRTGTGGPAITAGDDARITGVGRWLRRSKVDELPQLLNVLRGEMSIVGPRPEDGRYVERYSEDQRRVLDWRPGITSPASIAFRDEQELLDGVADLDAAYAEIMARKLDLDLAYLPTATLVSDLGVVRDTLLAVVRPSATQQQRPG